MFEALALLFSAFLTAAEAPQTLPQDDVAVVVLENADTAVVAAPLSDSIANPGVVTANALIAYAQTFKGTRYKYASADPAKGFDCSGFVMYVFNHFQMTVPRSSIGYSKVGQEVELKDALPGDLILFTGTNAKIRKIGHVGIITQANEDDSISFIHASSGKAYSVTETTLGEHYKKRFMKVVRLLH